MRLRRQPLSCRRASVVREQCGRTDQIGVRIVAIVAMEMATLPLLSLIAVFVFLPGALSSEFVAPQGSLGVHSSAGTIFSAAAYQLARRSRRSSGAPVVELGSVDTPHSPGLELMREIIRHRRNSSPNPQQAPAAAAVHESPLSQHENTVLSPEEKAVMNLFDLKPTTRKKRKSNKKTTTTPMPDYDYGTDEVTLSPEEKKKFEEGFELFSVTSSNATSEAELTVVESKGESPDPKEKPSRQQPDDRSSASEASTPSSKPSTESTTQPTPTPTLTTTEKPPSQPGPGISEGEAKSRDNTQKVNNQTEGYSEMGLVKSEQGKGNNGVQKHEGPSPSSDWETPPEEAPKTHGETEKKHNEHKTSSELEHGDVALKKDEEFSQRTNASIPTNPTPAVPKQVAPQHEETQMRHKDSNDPLERQAPEQKKDSDEASVDTPSEASSGARKHNDETTKAAPPPSPSGSSTAAAQNMTKTPVTGDDPAVTAAPKSPEVQDSTHYSHAQQSNQYIAMRDPEETSLLQSASELKPEGIPRVAALVGPPYLKFRDDQGGQRSQSSSYSGFQDAQIHQDLGIYRQQSNQDLNTFRGPQNYQGSQGVQSFQSSQSNQDLHTYRGPQSYQGSQGLQSLQSSQSNQDLYPFRGPQSYQNPQDIQNFQRPHTALSSQTPQGLQNFHISHGAGDGAPRAAAVTQQRSQQAQATPQVFSRWFGDVMQWSDAQELLYRVKTGQELPAQDYRGVRITYKVNGYSEPPPPQPTPPALPPYSPPSSQLVVAGPGNSPAVQTPVYPGALYHQQFASSHPQVHQAPPDLSAGTASYSKPTIVVVPFQYGQPSLPGASIQRPGNEYLAPSHSLPYQSPAASLSNAPAAQPGLQGGGYALPGAYTPSSWANQAQPSIPPYLIRVYTKQEPQRSP